MQLSTQFDGPLNVSLSSKAIIRVVWRMENYRRFQGINKSTNFGKVNLISVFLPLSSFCSITTPQIPLPTYKWFRIAWPCESVLQMKSVHTTLQFDGWLPSFSTNFIFILYIYHTKWIIHKMCLVNNPWGIVFRIPFQHAADCIRLGQGS